MKKIAINGINTDNCPCKECHAKHESYIGCHSKCLKYIDWKQQHEVTLESNKQQRYIDNLLFDTQTSRNKKLSQTGGVKYGRRSNGSR